MLCTYVDVTLLSIFIRSIGDMVVLHKLFRCRFVFHLISGVEHNCSDSRYLALNRWLKL